MHVSTQYQVQDFKIGLTFDDVLLAPKFSDIRSRKEVSTDTLFTRNVRLNIPIVSANMDTVTEATMAIALARLGGIGVVHRFLSIEDEVAEVTKVKRSEGIVIEDPITLTAEHTVQEAKNIIKKHNIGGIVIIDQERKVLGLVTRRDIELEDNGSIKLVHVMTPRSRLVTAPPGISIEEAKQILFKNKVEKLPIVDAENRLLGLITAKDILKRKQFPLATKDDKGRLRVAAAVGVRGDFMQRAQRLLDADADIIVIDIAHGHSFHCIEAIKAIKKEFGDVEVIAGNVATSEGTTDLIKAGADAVKVGVGPGSICITRLVTGFGVPQLTAIIESSKVAEDYGVPIIADGGIRHPGDVTKAIAAGASSVMIGSLFAGTEESPGPTVLRNGIRYKLTRGMASLTATIDRRLRESSYTDSRENELVEEAIEETVPEGVEGLIPYKGRVEEVVKQLVGGLRSGMSYCGAHNLKDLKLKAQFIRITEAGYRESLPHDIERVA